MPWRLLQNVPRRTAAFANSRAAGATYYLLSSPTGMATVAALDGDVRRGCGCAAAKSCGNGRRKRAAGAGFGSALALRPVGVASASAYLALPLLSFIQRPAYRACLSVWRVCGCRHAFILAVGIMLSPSRILLSALSSLHCWRIAAISTACRCSQRHLSRAMAGGLLPFSNAYFILPSGSCGQRPRAGCCCAAAACAA